MHTLPYASFSRRASARLIDLCVVLVPCCVFYLIDRALGFPLKYTSLFSWKHPESATMFMSDDFPGVFIIFVSIKLLIAYPYFALMESGRWQGTIGKQVMQIKVTDLKGNPITFARATGRYFLKIISSVEFMLGYLISFSDQRQTIHDYLSQVLVVRKGTIFSDSMPGVPSGVMFDVPFLLPRRDTTRRESAWYECVWCNYRAIGIGRNCPNCGRLGWVPVGVLRGMLLMAGLIFTLIGCALAYLTFCVIRDRLIDDRLGREGTPWGLVFIISVVCAFCMLGGLSSIIRQKWLVRVLLSVGFGLRPR